MPWKYKEGSWAMGLIYDKENPEMFAIKIESAITASQLLVNEWGELICQAVNSHNELLEACKLVERAWVGDGISMSTAIDATLLAIAKAQGG